ncbi:hypothetical protein BOX15_Mlig012893g2, partial [Macrostomum lignano]
GSHARPRRRRPAERPFQLAELRGPGANLLRCPWLLLAHLPVGELPGLAAVQTHARLASAARGRPAAYGRPDLRQGPGLQHRQEPVQCCPRPLVAAPVHLHPASRAHAPPVGRGRPPSGQPGRPDASRGQLPQSMVFLVYVMLLSFLIDLPWSVYKNFVLEARHGFNKQTPGFYAKDQLKSLLLSMAIGLPIAAALLWLIERGGPYFYVYAWLLASVVIFVLMLVYPSFIAPLFDTYEPLREGQLKQRIEDLAKRLEFPLTQLLVIEGSRRSAHSNAYLFGLWRSKRIVLFDTLIEGYQMQSVKEKEEKEREKREKEKAAEGQGEKSDEAKAEPDSAAGEEKEKEAKKGCNDDEILAVLGHELGHWSLGHNVSNIFISEVNLFLMFFAFGQLLNCHSAFAAFGFQQPAPLLLRLAFVLEFLLSPYNELLGFAMICLTRLFEFQADRFSVRLGFGQQLKTALIKLHTDNLSYPLFDPLYSAFNHSHPTVLHRLAAIDQAEAEDEAKTK